MRPEEIVVGRDYLLRVFFMPAHPRTGHIFTVEKPPRRVAVRCLNCKNNIRVLALDLMIGDKHAVCPCCLHPIPDPDAAPLPAEKESLPA